MKILVIKANNVVGFMNILEACRNKIMLNYKLEKL